MSFNERQQEAIDCNVNCVVSAGAGSGKTEVLTTRFIRLVEEKKAHCDEILTITFTRKATSEMKARIHEKLIKSADTEELKRFPFCAVSTVDGFCASIVRSDCTRYGFAPNFSVLDEDDFKKVAGKIARELFSENIETDCIRRLISNMGIEDAVNMFVELANGKFNIVKPIDPEKNAKTVIELVSSWLKQAQDDFINVSDSLMELLSKDEKSDTNLKALETAQMCFEKKDYKALKNIRLSVQKGSKEITDILKEKRPHFYSAICECITYSDVLANEVFITELYQLISVFENRINSKKRELGSMFFIDTMKCAIDILTVNKKIRRKFKRKYRYIMIDEFQDNNDDYRKLLYLLAEDLKAEKDGIPQYSDLAKDKIFLVGDEKQSIYKFRGADVSVFKKLCDEIGHKIELETNYRSQKELVEAFNVMFRHVMENDGQAYEADFKELGYSKNEIRGKILFHNYLKNSEDKEKGTDYATATQSEAKSLADLIHTMVTTDDFLIADSEGRPVRPKERDIAILFRTGSHQSDYEKALRLRGIKYTTAEAKGLTTEAVFYDLYTVLQLCLYPYDKASWASFLKGPFCHLQDKEIAEILNDIPENYTSEIESVRQMLKTGTLPEVLDYIYYEMGYRNFLITNPSNRVYCEHYDYLYAIACDFEKAGKGISEFLDFIRPLLGDSAKIKELKVFGEETEGVNLMTIHKSKGLGFPIVIVAGMEASGSRNGNGYSVSVTEYKTDDVLFLNCVNSIRYDDKYNKFSEKFENPYTYRRRDEDELKEIAELKRLLYVAATRAKCHLVFSASYKEPKSESKSTSMAKMLIDSTDFKFETQQATKIDMVGRKFNLIPVEETYSSKRLTAEDFKQKGANYDNFISTDFKWEKETCAVTKLSSSDKHENSFGLPLKVLDSDRILSLHNISTDFGTYTHACIESKIKNSDKPQLICKDISTEEHAVLQRDAQMLAESFFNSDVYKTISNCTLYSEREFFINDNGVILNGVIDLLAVSENEVYIVDFKTDKFKNSEEYENQLYCYRKAVESVYPDRSVKCYLIYLRDADNPVML